LPGGGAKAEQGNRLCLTEEDVAQLGAGKGFLAEIVVAVDVFVPQAGIVPDFAFVGGSAR
jgi:hypothetical protein